MAFQDFISGKVSEKAALESALVRVVAELQAANNAAPAVDDAVNKIKGLISVLQSSPASVVDAAKEAIRDACGDISLLPQNKEVTTIVVPRFVVETKSPVLADMLGETETESEIKATVDVVIEPQPIEDKPQDSTLQVKIPKRRTQSGFEAKRKEWLDILNGLSKENYQVSISKVDDEYKYWTNGSKFESDLIEVKLQEAIAYWTTLDQSESEAIIENNALEDLTASNDVVETDTDKTQVDLSSFDVEEETTEDSNTSEEKLEKIEEERKLAEFWVQLDLWIDRVASYSIDNADSVQIKIANIDKILSDIAQIENEYRLYADSGWEKEHPTQLESKLRTAKGHWESLKKAISTEENITQKFLNRLNSDLSEAGLSDLQEEIRTLYGSGHIPQKLLDAIIVAWKRLNDNDDDLDDDNVGTEAFESKSNNSEEIEEYQDDESVDIYDGDIPAEEELTDDTDQPTENLENIAQNKIVADNLSWQNSILTNCETWEELKEWDKFIANAVNKNPDSVLPETFTALDTTRSKLEARDAQQAKTVDVESLTQAWLNRAELAFDLEEIQTIYNEIRESGIVPSMALIKTLDAAKARLTPVVPVELEINDTAIADARDCIGNQWDNAQPKPTIEVQVQSTTTKADPFKGRKSNKGQITVEFELQGLQQTQDTSDSITISSINTSGVFEFQTLDGKSEKHHRFDSRYILDPGTKLFELSTKYVFEVATWEEVMSLNPLIAENPNKLPLKSLHNPKRNYGKDADKTDVFVIVSDEQADQFVQEYRATLVQMESDPNPTIGS